MKNFDKMIDSKDIFIRNCQDIIDNLGISKETLINMILNEYKTEDDIDADEILSTTEYLEDDIILETIINNQKHKYSEYECYQLHHNIEIWSDDLDYEIEPVSVWKIKFFNLKQ